MMLTTLVLLAGLLSAASESRHDALRQTHQLVLSSSSSTSVGTVRIPSCIDYKNPKPAVEALTDTLKAQALVPMATMATALPTDPPLQNLRTTATRDPFVAQLANACAAGFSEWAVGVWVGRFMPDGFTRSGTDLQRKWDKYLQSCIVSLKLAMERLVASWDDLVAAFDDIDSSGRLMRVTRTDSDPHDLNQRVLFLDFKSHRWMGLSNAHERVVYKPRSMMPEALVQGEGTSFAAVVNKLVGGSTELIKTYTVVEGKNGDYGFMEFITRSAADFETSTREGSDRAINRWSRATGALAAEAVLLGVSDLHMENVMLRHAFPYIIDAEAMFYPNKGAGQGKPPTSFFSLARGHHDALMGGVVYPEKSCNGLMMVAGDSVEPTKERFWEGYSTVMDAVSTPDGIAAVKAWVKKIDKSTEFRHVPVSTSTLMMLQSRFLFFPKTAPDRRYLLDMVPDTLVSVCSRTPGLRADCHAFSTGKPFVDVFQRQDVPAFFCVFKSRDMFLPETDPETGHHRLTHAMRFWFDTPYTALTSRLNHYRVAYPRAKAGIAGVVTDGSKTIKDVYTAIADMG